MAHHDLKCFSRYFQAIKRRVKTFEIRKNDRNFAVDDTLTLREVLNGGDIVTGWIIDVKVTYITDFKQKDGYVIMGIEIVEPFVVEGELTATFDQELPLPQKAYIKSTPDGILVDLAEISGTLSNILGGLRKLKDRGVITEDEFSEMNGENDE